jgi:hypothetical protein
MFASTVFFLGAALNLILFFVLIWTVFTVFDISKRSKSIEKRLIDLQEELHQVKRSVLPPRV